MRSIDANPVGSHNEASFGGGIRSKLSQPNVTSLKDTMLISQHSKQSYGNEHFNSSGNYIELP